MGANLQSAVLMGADLHKADLFDAKLDDANLFGAKLDGANLTDATWPLDAEIPEGWQRDADSGRLKRADMKSGGKPAG
jgi:uncharacterized protein YjbI with pentapeptide repeats